ncbi:BQ2448_2454 [Microbotryum intermedium]|uniref:BQ2448_2454 protein n=1 Tax=Microbotryum intermedium TaxID=269621 RepID=A0A238FC13_9BASI|nr:BQ2448_2454 [Microbotryum intermedium]
MQASGVSLPCYDVAKFGLNATTILDDIINNSATDDLLSLVADLAHRWFYADMPVAYTTQLKVMSGIFAVETLLFVASLLVRARVPSAFWVFKWTKTPAGDYITPHFAVSWQLASVCFLLVCQRMLWVGTLHAKGVHCLSWSLYVAQSVSAHSRKPHWSTSPRFLNVHFCALLAVIPIVIGLSVFADSRYERVYRTSEGLRRSALAYAQADHPTRAQAASMLRASTPTVQSVLDGYARFIDLFRAVWIVWLIGTAYIYFILCIIASRYFAFLRGELRKVDEEKFSESDPIHRNSAIRSAFWNALWTCVCVTAIGTVFTGTVFFVVFATRLVVLNGYAFSVVALLTFWTFGVCAFPAGMLSLMRSIQGLPGREKESFFVFKARSQSRRTPIPSARSRSRYTNGATMTLDPVETNIGLTSHVRPNGRIEVAGPTIHDSAELELSGDEPCATHSGTTELSLEKKGSLDPATLGRRHGEGVVVPAPVRESEENEV